MDIQNIRKPEPLVDTVFNKAVPVEFICEAMTRSALKRYADEIRNIGDEFLQASVYTKKAVV
jgi:hypothetical protein